MEISESSSPKNSLLRSLQNEGILNKSSIIEALQKIHREDFLWPGYPKTLAYLDEPIPLGDTGQTISAPHMIVMMLEALDISRGMKVLEVGTGSGYNAALIGEIVSREIKEINSLLVLTIERNQNLARFAARNLANVGLESVVKVVSGDGSVGYPENYDCPLYDRIMITAATPSIPRSLLKQLKQDGILLAPVGSLTFQTLVRVRKVLSDGKQVLESEDLVGCVFVPLIGEQGFRP